MGAAGLYPMVGEPGKWDTNLRLPSALADGDPLLHVPAQCCRLSNAAIRKGRRQEPVPRAALSSRTASPGQPRWHWGAAIRYVFRIYVCCDNGTEPRDDIPHPSDRHSQSPHSTVYDFYPFESALRPLSNSTDQSC